MRYSALLGNILASALAGLSYGTLAGQMTQISTLAPYNFFGTDRFVGAPVGGRSGVKAQRHTGASARGMHRAWKKRRASGRH